MKDVQKLTKPSGVSVAIFKAEDNFGLSREEAEALKKPRPLQLQKIIKQSTERRTNDQRLPEEIRQNFCSDKFLFSPDDAVQLWNNFHAVIYEFNGDADHFFSSYYGLLCDNLLSCHLSGSDVVDVGIP